MVIECRERINLRHREQDIAAREPNQVLDMPLLVGPPHQAEV
jgi:hypothetical protein